MPGPIKRIVEIKTPPVMPGDIGLFESKNLPITNQDISMPPVQAPANQQQATPEPESESATD